MMYGDIMAKLVHVQTIIEEERLIELKERTGEHATKDALSKAIDHYLECENVKSEKTKVKNTKAKK